MNAITKTVWIGEPKDAMECVGFEAMLNVAFDLPECKQWPQVRSAHCGLVDGPGNRPADYVAAVMSLHGLIAHAQRVLVYCHGGRSRSVAVVIMYLHAMDLLGHGGGWDGWLAKVKEQRPEAEPHEAHRQAFHAIDWRAVRGIITVE